MFVTLLAASSSGSGGSVAPLLFFLLIAVAMYLLLIRPQRRRMQEQRALASSVAEGDEVMTTAGVYGFVTAIEDDVIWLEIAEGVDIRIARGAVSRKVTPADTSDTAAAAGDAKPAGGTKAIGDAKSDRSDTRKDEDAQQGD
jgi:preprotein translocase subunit YajC